VNEDKVAEELRLLRAELRRAVRIYVAFWLLDTAALFAIFAKIAHMW
jgi:hypothetical protein